VTEPDFADSSALMLATFSEVSTLPLKLVSSPGNASVRSNGPRPSCLLTQTEDGTTPEALKGVPLTAALMLTSVDGDVSVVTSLKDSILTTSFQPSASSMK